MPYQTLIGSFLHRFASSELIAKSEDERLQKVTGVCHIINADRLTE